MKRLQGGKVVDYNPFTEPVHTDQKFEAPTSMSPIKTTVVPDVSVAEVLAWVGDDPDRASAALEVELAKDAPRSTLVDKLS